MVTVCTHRERCITMILPTVLCTGDPYSFFFLCVHNRWSISTHWMNEHHQSEHRELGGCDAAATEGTQGVLCGFLRKHLFLKYQDKMLNATYYWSDSDIRSPNCGHPHVILSPLLQNTTHTMIPWPQPSSPLPSVSMHLVTSYLKPFQTVESRWGNHLWCI